MLLYTLLSEYADVKLAVEAMPITDNLSVAIIIADVAELVDALISGVSGETRADSNSVIRTIQ